MMKAKIGFSGLFAVLFPIVTYAAQNIYCAQHASTIEVGMSTDQVLAACGAPTVKMTTNLQATEKVAVKQLVYNAVNTGGLYPGMNDAFYNNWSLPSGNTGISLIVDLIDNKVSSVKLNGSSSNAITICSGAKVQVGDDIGRVYAACGQPSMVNLTYINTPLPASAKPEKWIYHVDQYQPQMTLTFINGRLESIN